MRFETITPLVNKAIISTQHCVFSSNSALFISAQQKRPFNLPEREKRSEGRRSIVPLRLEKRLLRREGQKGEKSCGGEVGERRGRKKIAQCHSASISSLLSPLEWASGRGDNNKGGEREGGHSIAMGPEGREKGAETTTLRTKRKRGRLR